MVVVKGEIDIATAPLLSKALAKFSKKRCFSTSARPSSWIRPGSRS